MGEEAATAVSVQLHSVHSVFSPCKGFLQARRNKFCFVSLSTEHGHGLCPGNPTQMCSTPSAILGFLAILSPMCLLPVFSSLSLSTDIGWGGSCRSLKHLGHFWEWRCDRVASGPPTGASDFVCPKRQRPWCGLRFQGSMDSGYQGVLSLNPCCPSHSSGRCDDTLARPTHRSWQTHR